MSLKEEDPFKRFMWAFAGLEVLSGKAAQSWKSRALTLIASNESISLELAKELLWPTDGDESREPWRSLVFRFSIMAIVVNAETATDDLVKFKDIQSFRNKIHGHHIDERVVEQKAAVAMDLLRRYAPSVVDSLQRRPGIPLCLILAILANTICGQRG